MKKYFLYAIVVLSFSGLAQTPAPSMAQFNQAAAQCQDLKCVRNNIDTVDSQIVALIGQRLAYVQRAGKLKGATASVHDATREATIMASVTAQAQAIGYSPLIARSVFANILLQSNIYEARFHN